MSLFLRSTQHAERFSADDLKSQGGVPAALLQGVAEFVDEGPGRWKLASESLLERSDRAVVVRQVYREWRQQFESVFRLGQRAQLEQFVRIVVGLVAPERPAFPDELAKMVPGGFFQGDEVADLREQFDDARGLLGEIATPGWALVGTSSDDTSVQRRDLSLGGDRLLAEVGELVVRLNPREGYVLYRDGEAVGRIVKVDASMRQIYLDTGPVWDLVGDEPACLVGEFARTYHGVWEVAEITAADVFAPLVGTVDLALGQAGLYREGTLYLFEGDDLEPLYTQS